MEKPPEAPHSPLFDPSYVNALSHFYRGELGRMMVWRQRLDTTTTWAITTTSTICMVAFSFRDVPHLIFLFNLAIVSIMLWIEARRYRFYDAFRARVRLLEAHFLVPMMLQRTDMLQGNWKELLCEDLILPAFKISTFEAVGRRLKRNYVFLYVILQTAWLAKIFMHAPQPVDSWAGLYAALTVGEVAGWVVAALFIFTLLAVVGIAIYISRTTTGEFTEFSGTKSLWRI
jgi:uncharacterized membrane protein